MHKLMVFLLLFFISNPCLAKNEIEKLDWNVIYFMSYDNNLAFAGPIILKELQKGLNNVGSKRIVINVLADFPDKVTDGPGLLKLILKSKSEIQITKIDSDASSSEEIVKEYLNETIAKFPAKKVAVIFLDHGGRLDEMSNDGSPGKTKKNWLLASKIGPLISNIRTELIKQDSNLEMLFLQQCGRGSLENLFSFKGAAESIISSQFNVGAPNTYYRETLEWLGKNSAEVKGVQLANKIVSSDKHFTNYVVVRGDELKHLPVHFDKIFKGITMKSLREDVKLGKLSPTFEARGRRRHMEYNFDISQVIAASKKLSKNSDAQSFLNWLKKDLIIQLSTNKRIKHQSDLIGLSLFIPSDDSLVDEYKNMPIYRESSLWKKEKSPTRLVNL